MESCPVCETPHPPAALECAVCGRIFAAAEVAIAAAALPELEPTLLASSAVGPIESLAELEATSFEGAPPPSPADRLMELEPTQLASGPDLPSEPPVDLEPTAQVPLDAPTAQGELRCRACGAVGQAKGLFCDACGMRLPRLRDEPSAAPAGASAGAACRACGARRFLVGLCADCGTPAPVP